MSRASGTSDSTDHAYTEVRMRFRSVQYRWQKTIPSQRQVCAYIRNACVLIDYAVQDIGRSEEGIAMGPNRTGLAVAVVR